MSVSRRLTLAAALPLDTRIRHAGTYAYIRLHSQLIVMRHRRDRRDTFSAIVMPLVDVELGIVQQLVLRVEVEAGGEHWLLLLRVLVVRQLVVLRLLAAEPPLRGRMREAFARGAEHSICRRMRPVIVRVWLRCAPALRWQPALVPALQLFAVLALRARVLGFLRFAAPTQSQFA